MPELKKKIEEIQQLEAKGIDNSKYKQELLEIWQERGRENYRDKAIYETFVQNAEEGKEKNNNRFRLSYIFNIPIPWNILLVLGKKNIGKTYQIHQLIKECIKEDRWVILVRPTFKECKTALQPLLAEPESAVTLRAGAMNTYDIILKPQSPEDVLKGKKLRKKVGFACSLSTLTSYQGASFHKVKYIICDEFISDGGSIKIKGEDINSLERFISSMTRDKTDVKTIIFANLLEKVTGMAGDPILAHYGINPECSCKYIEGKKSHEASVLFINTKQLFTGIDKQGVIGGVHNLASSSLLTNTLTPRGIKTVSPREFYKAHPRYTLLFTYNTEIIVIQIHETTYINCPKYYVVNISKYIERLNFTSVIYTNEEALYNNYSNSVTYVEEDDWVDLLDDIREYCRVGRVIYANEESSLEMNKYMKHFANVQSSTVKKSFSGRSRWKGGNTSFTS